MFQSTASQSSTTSYNNNNSAVTSSDGRWNQVDSTNILNNTTPLEWSKLPTESNESIPASSNNVSSDYQVTSSVNKVNVINNQIVYNPPNYMNVPYQTSAVPNGYITLDPTRRANAQIMNGPNFIHTPNGQTIGGSAWRHQTPLGRFITQTSGWTSNKATGAKKQKRIRTAFTSQQMMDLEQEYSRTRYLDRARRIELAESLRLNERTIKIWFQNRRMKEKKDRVESFEDSEEASTSESSAEMSNNQMPMLIHEQYQHIKDEVYNQGNVYLEQYPVVSTPISIPGTSLATSMAPVQVQTQNIYPTHMDEEEYQSQYQEVHLEDIQPYATPFNQVQELSQEVVPKTEPPTPTDPSSIIKKSWDLSWIRPMQFEDDF